jgi:phenylacetate-CoA ligase
MFVHPGQLEAVMGERPEVGRYQLVVRRKGFEDDLVLRVETTGAAAELAPRLEARLREAIKLRARVEIVASGTLAPDGKKISDERTWD